MRENHAKSFNLTYKRIKALKIIKNIIIRIGKIYHICKEVNCMKKDNEKLLLKKQTLTAWANILLAKGMIDLAKCNRMKSLIEKLTA